MKPIRAKLIVKASFLRPTGEEFEKTLDLFFADDLAELRDLSRKYYFKSAIFPVGGLSEILSYFQTGSTIRNKPPVLPRPAPSNLKRWKRLTPPIEELQASFPGMEIEKIDLWRDEPPQGKKRKGVYSHVAPKGFEVLVTREYWSDACQKIDRVRIRTRQKNRPVPVENLRKIAAEFFGDRIFWFDLERTNTNDPIDEDFHRYHFLSVANQREDLVSLLRNGSVFLDLLYSLSNRKSEAKFITE